MDQYYKKPLSWLLNESANENKNTLKRTLNGFQLLMLGLGVIIGAGLFSLTGPAAGNNAGPAVTLSFVVAGVGCAFAGLCYAEFASMIPVAEAHTPMPISPWANGVPFVPIMGILTCAVMMAFLPWNTWLRLIVWMAIGMAIYEFYGKHHSKVRNQLKS